MNTEKKRRPIRKRVRTLLLVIAATVMLLSDGLGILSIMRLQNAVEESLAQQLELNLYNTIADKAALADVEFGRYLDEVDGFAQYIHELYTHPEKHVFREVQPPDAANDGIWAIQRTLADREVNLEDLRYELALFGCMELPWDIAVRHGNDIITSIYVGAKSGFMVAYDPHATLVEKDPATGDAYYDFRNSDWYAGTRQRNSVGFTDIYNDYYGRGTMVSCSAPFFDGEGEFRGVVCMDVLISDIYNKIVSLDIGEGGKVYLVDKAGNTIDENQGIVPFADLMGGDSAAGRVLDEESGFFLTEDGVYCAYATVPQTGWKLCITMPQSTVFAPVYEMKRLTEQLLILFVVFLVVLGAAVVIISDRFAKSLTEPIVALGKDALTISGGNLDYRAEVRDNDEIGDLAGSFNQMAESLQQYIKDLTAVTAEKERIGAELNVATQIQADMLPRIFPPFPDRKSIDIYASMTPAKEVGGDFYDFFLTDDDHLAMVMADVSGKGVPAALFMVIAKTLIKNRAQMGGTPAEILYDVNNTLCDGNEAGLFVTVWLAVIDLRTGKGLAANAGHEHPAVRRKDGSFELIKYRHSPAVATMEGMRFREHEFQLDPGDTLFVYTDGVAEATDAHDVLFGEERTLEALNRNPNAKPRIIVDTVKAAIDEFVGDAVQFDDITMLCLDYYGDEEEQKNV